MFHEVWTCNFHDEFEALLEAVANNGGASALVALDTEFPGVVREGWRNAARAEQYEALRCNVDFLLPVQLGLAVASASDGALAGVWSFNLRFDVRSDLHTEASIAFLSAAGVDFPRHADEGIEGAVLGSRLAASPLVGTAAPWWLTFAGMYDLGYLMKLVAGGVACASARLPLTPEAFDAATAAVCPRRCELRNWFPHGSLQTLVEMHGVVRRGAAHTAGSDALATLELFLRTFSASQRTMMVSQAAPDARHSSPERAVLLGPPPGLEPPAAKTSAAVAPPPGLAPPAGEMADAFAPIVGGTVHTPNDKGMGPPPGLEFVAAPLGPIPTKSTAGLGPRPLQHGNAAAPRSKVSWAAAARSAMVEATAASQGHGRAAPSNMWSAAARAAAVGQGASPAVAA